MMSLHQMRDNVIETLVGNDVKTISLCDMCEEYDVGNRYGKLFCCDKCKESLEKVNLKKPPEIVLNLGEMEADFRPLRNVISINSFIGVERLYVCINHEYMHYVLLKHIGMEASICYDAVSGEGEIHENWL